MQTNRRTHQLMDDIHLKPYHEQIKSRLQRFRERKCQLCNGARLLKTFACAHEYYGLHRTDVGWVFREYAPHATAMWLIGDFSNWMKWDEFRLNRITDSGDWEVHLPPLLLSHGQHYQLHVEWDGGHGRRLPAYARRIVQDYNTTIFTAQVWLPDQPYQWKHKRFRVPERTPFIYECHVGMSQESAKIATYVEFTEKTLPRIAKAGYNTIQLMAIMEHPYYGSFGYQVANFFAASSRFGTPEEFKALVDAAHELGIAVIVDLIHSHAVLNEADGIAKFDGTSHIYCHDGERGHHPVWDSACFDYGRISTLHFLLSNCRYWLDEFKVDGFRFDGVTSMLYLHHGIGIDFMSYDQYFDATVDEDAYTYLALANQVIHEVRSDAITIAEDVSGMPGLGAEIKEGGAGFDMRMAMGITETWGKLIRKVSDEDWDLGLLWYELTNRRADECTVSYIESHDQALVGGKTMFFELAGPAIYDSMHVRSQSLPIERAVALHKMMRLLTLATAGHGYLNFMGNEFGHPDWIDFPRAGNNFSCQYARRQWSLRDNDHLQFKMLGDFDEALLKLFAETPDVFKQSAQSLMLGSNAKVMGVARGRFVVLANLSPTQSYSDLGVIVPDGEYALRLSTDAPEFGGHGRIAEGQVFHTLSSVVGQERVSKIQVYLPARTAIVVEREAGDYNVQ